MNDILIKNITEKNLEEQINKNVRQEILNHKLPPGPDRNSDEANFILNSNLIYKKLVNEYIPKYGPIITLYRNDRPLIFVNDIDIAYDIFVRKFSKEISGRSTIYGDKIVSGMKNNILDSDYGPLWKVLRRMLHKGLRSCANQERLYEIMFKCFEKFKEIIEYRSGSKSEEMNVMDDLFRMSDNVITMLIFNEIFDDEEHLEIHKAMKSIAVLAEECDFINCEPESLSDFQLVKDLSNVFNQFSTILQKRIDSHRQKGNYKIACFDITDYILLGVEEYHLDPRIKKLGVKLTDIHVKHSLIDVIFASQEGLGNSFVWFIGLLALYPDIQDKIRDEINKFKDDKNDPVTLHWKSKMPYTNAALCEFQRYASADSFTNIHSVMNDITIGPFHIPKDSLVLLNLYAIHHDKKMWNRPEIVNPQNFLTEDGLNFKRRKDFVPYGLGLRTCVGNTFSENVLFLLIMLFVDNFKLVWGKNNKREIIDDTHAVFIRDVEPFNIQFIKLK